MRDADVRAAVLQMLNERHDANTRIVQEMGIWSGAVRVDVAVINGELQGYELKSASDTLERLPVQASLYSQVFDRVVLVTAERHVRHATDKIPRWWGVTFACADDAGGTGLREIVPPDRNPNIDPLQLARLLWRDEALSVLEKHHLDHGVRSRPVEVLAARLTEKLLLDDLRHEVREILKQRAGWLGKPVRNEAQMPID